MEKTNLYTEEELTSFGSYLLSDERKSLIMKHPDKGMRAQAKERLKYVSHADLLNWKTKRGQIKSN